MKYCVRDRAIQDAVPILTRKKRCVRCHKLFLPIKRDHNLCGSCFTDMLGSTPNRVYRAKIFELRQKIGNKSHLTINTCENCRFPFIVSMHDSNRIKFCPDCVNVKRKITSRKSKKENRNKILQSRGNKCERCLCDNKEVLEIHHKDQNRLNGDDENLEVLCANCHTLEHKQLNYISILK